MQLKKSSILPIKIFGGLVAIAYPIAIFVALHHGISVRMLGLFLGCAVLVSLVRNKNIWIGICGLLLTCMAVISNQEIFLRLYPVFMNAMVCMIFTVSLWHKPLVQQFAEKMKYKINTESRLYARRVTIAWAIFSGINTFVSLATVFMADWAWALYNGLISYCLIGIMFLGEYLVRIRVMHEHK